MISFAVIAGFLTFVFAFAITLGFFEVVVKPDRYQNTTDAVVTRVVRAKKFREDSTCNMAYYSYKLNDKLYKGKTAFNDSDDMACGDTISISVDKLRPRKSYYNYSYFLETREVYGGLIMVIGLVLLIALIILAV